MVHYYSIGLDVEVEFKKKLKTGLAWTNQKGFVQGHSSHFACFARSFAAWKFWQQLNVTTYQSSTMKIVSDICT